MEEQSVFLLAVSAQFQANKIIADSALCMINKRRAEAGQKTIKQPDSNKQNASIEKIVLHFEKAITARSLGMILSGVDISPTKEITTDFYSKFLSSETEESLTDEDTAYIKRARPAKAVRQWDEMVKKETENYPNIPESLALAIMHQESYGDPNATPVDEETGEKKTSAVGLYQLTEAAAKDAGVMGPGFDSRYDPEENIRGGLKYYNSLLNESLGDHSEALARYHEGSGTINKMIRSVNAGGAPKISDEFRTYIPRILKLQAEYRKAGYK